MSKPSEYHARFDGLTVPTPSGGRVFARGATLVVDDRLVELTTDRNGESWASDLSEAAQLARWGAVRWGAGPVSSDPVLEAEIATEKAAAAAVLAQERLLSARRYGSRYVLAHEAMVAAVRNGENV